MTGNLPPSKQPWFLEARQKARIRHLERFGVSHDGAGWATEPLGWRPARTQDPVWSMFEHQTRRG